MERCKKKLHTLSIVSAAIREGEEKKIEAQDNKIAERMKKCHTNEQNEQNDFEIS